jgi:hypothetical protein
VPDNLDPMSTRSVVFAVAILMLGIGMTPFHLTREVGSLLIVISLLMLAYLYATRKANDLPDVRDGLEEKRSAWRDMAVRFDNIDPRIWADWFSEGYGFDGLEHGELWTVRGDGLDISQCETLCKIAGAMLLNSAESIKMSDKVLTRSDDMYRWLYFLEERRGSKSSGTGSSAARGFVKQTTVRTIKSVAKSSSVTCLEIASNELW